MLRTCGTYAVQTAEVRMLKNVDISHANWHLWGFYDSPFLFAPQTLLLTTKDIFDYSIPRLGFTTLE